MSADVTPQEIVKDLSDAYAIIMAFVTSNPGAAIQPAADLILGVLRKLPPLDAAALDPGDRAAADAAIEAEESKT